MNNQEGVAGEDDDPPLDEQDEPSSWRKELADFKTIGSAIKTGLQNERIAAGRTKESLRHKWGIVKSWHTTKGPDLFREIYARTVATLLAGLIAYSIAVWTTGAPKEPLRFLGLAGAILGFLTVVWMIVHGMADVLKSGVSSYIDVIAQTPHVIRRTLTAVLFFVIGTLCIAWFRDVSFWDQLIQLGPPVAVVVVVTIFLYLGAVAKKIEHAAVKHLADRDDEQLTFNFD
jgi:hypothetical protein